MNKPLLLVAALVLTACSATEENTKSPDGLSSNSQHAHNQYFDNRHNYLPHDHAAHYVNNEPRGPLVGWPTRSTSPRHSQDGIPMRMSAGSRSVHLPSAGPTLVGGQTQLQHQISTLAYRLLSSSHNLNAQSAIAVSGFVDQQDYTSQDDFSRFLSETMMYQLNQYGLKVIDFKTLPYIRITPQGDISTSRDYRQLSSNVDAEYILQGTITNVVGGRLVNARLVSMADHSVNASAQQFIPSYLVSTAVKLQGPTPRVMTPAQKARYAK